ncbi:MAG TPA: secondary thiamine-phosphate synthase enzyme YjbQ [Syntrophales bacterium]|nr:secondary thiamine-phosphate synthase enzyme YjbQ [Syntrophales bacterium]
MESLSLQTSGRSEMVDITAAVRRIVRESGVRQGICRVFVPHTTAAVTINENADPDVPRDILDALEKIVPWNGRYRHREGNAAAHVKASLFGTSQSVFVEGGDLVLGTWQSLFFCEFDGPRTRRVLVNVFPGGK